MDGSLANVSRMASKLVTAIVLTTWHARASTRCDNGWVEYTRSCFLLQTSMSTFTEAENHCLQHGGHLTSIHDSDEANFLRMEIKKVYRSLPDIKHSTFWIGYNGRDGWTDGTEVNYRGWTQNTTRPEDQPPQYVSIGRTQNTTRPEDKTPQYISIGRNRDTTRPEDKTPQFVSIGWNRNTTRPEDQPPQYISIGRHWSVDSNSSALHFYICRKHQGKWKAGHSRQDLPCLKSSSVGASTRSMSLIHKFISSLHSTSEDTLPLSPTVQQSSKLHVPTPKLRRNNSQTAQVWSRVNGDSSSKSKREVNTGGFDKSIKTRNILTNKKYQLENRASETLNSSINEVKKNNLSEYFNTKNTSINFATEVNKYENNTTPLPVTPNTVHVVIGILGIIVFVTLICGLFINDLKSMMLHIVRGEEGRASRETQALSHSNLTVNANYQNEYSFTETLSQSRERLSFHD